MAKITAEELAADMPQIERIATGFWQRVLDDALEDGRVNGLAEGIIIQSMVHLALCRYATLNGATATARELYCMASNFLKSGGMENLSNAQSSASKH